jgi:N-acetylmuramoyl-L-alanine amidase CwlA
MKVKTISYAKVFPLAAYVNEKIGVEIELDETDDWEETFSLAKRMVEKFHKDNNPQLTDGSNHNWMLTDEYGQTGKMASGPFKSTMPIIQSIDPKKKDETEIAIDNATTLEDLEKLLVDAAKYNLVSQFNEKKKMLQLQ